MLAQLKVNSILVPCAYARGSYPTLSAKPSVSVKLIAIYKRLAKLSSVCAAKDSSMAN